MEVHILVNFDNLRTSLFSCFARKTALTLIICPQVFLKLRHQPTEMRKERVARLVFDLSDHAHPYLGLLEEDFSPHRLPHPFHFSVWDPTSTAVISLSPRSHFHRSDPTFAVVIPFDRGDPTFNAVIQLSPWRFLFHRNDPTFAAVISLSPRGSHLW